MRHKENIEALVNVRPNFMGMIFYDKSKRFIPPYDISLPENFSEAKIQWVGVFVNEALENVISIASDLGLDYIQLHGGEELKYVISLHQKGFKIIKAFSIDSDFDFQLTSEFEPYCSYFLFDTKTVLYGGSGRKFDWSLLNGYSGSTPFMLSGGIRSNDVNELKELRHPQFVGVDINSQFEIQPGLKNIEMVKEFKERL